MNRILSPEQIREIEIRRITELYSDPCTEWGRAEIYKVIAIAQDAQTMKWLQEQCQELQPCEGCRPVPSQPNGCTDNDMRFCALFHHWQGRKEGYTLGLAKLWKVVDWLVPYKRAWIHEGLHDALIEWLGSQGISRPERT
jgi:hypothetical protein